MSKSTKKILTATNKHVEQDCKSVEDGIKDVKIDTQKVGKDMLICLI